jgi:hypothetical protein
MMGKRILKSKINYLVISIMITASGTVFFFPLNIDGKYTCFYHRIFDHSHPVSNEANLEHRHIHSEDLNQTENKNSTPNDKKNNDDSRNKVIGTLNQTENKNSTPNDKKNNDDSRNKVIGTHYRSVLLENYLHQYAFVWWLSVGLLALSIFMWLKLKKQDRKYKSGIVTQ